MRLSDSKSEIVRRGNKVVYRDGDRLLKVFNSEKPAADVFNEALNIARIENTGIRASGFGPLLVNSLLETNLGLPYIFLIHRAINRRWSENLRRLQAAG